MKNWKSWLKGIYDTEGFPPSIVVTGSAKLDTYRKEIDFLITRELLPQTLIEAKWRSGVLSPSFPIFTKYYPNTRRIQIVKELEREKTFPDGSEIRSAHNWLSTMKI